MDWLSERADVVVRFQGGHNAGHTLVIGSTTYKLSAAAVGRGAAGQVLRHRQWRRRRSVGVPEEVEGIRAKGVTVTPETLKIAENAVLILPLHGEIDRLREEARGVNKLGTTGPRHRPRV